MLSRQLKSRAIHALVILLFIIDLTPWVASGHSLGAGRVPEEVDPTPGPSPETKVDFTEAIFLPLVQHPNALTFSSSLPRINAHYFDGEIFFRETSIFWFGIVNPTENYTDVRVGYNAEELYIHLAIFDRSVWYDKTPTPQTFTEWDAASLYINLPGSGTYRFDGELNNLGPREAYQASYQRSGSSWLPVSIPFLTETGWRGDSPNLDTKDDGGWRITYHIPFTSLGLNAPPSQDTTWGLGVSVFDRDDEAGTPIPEKRWPDGMDPNAPVNWGQLGFGQPAYSAPPATSIENVVIRQGLEGSEVVDGMVGGGTDCGSTGVENNYYAEWGDANYAGAHQINVQNQYDVSDWPCFSKVYITFPLGKIPQGKTIVSATLTIFQFSNAGGGEYGIPPGSWIQVSKVNSSWNESTLTWNNAPQAMENIARTWVDWIVSPVPQPGIPRSWDVSSAVSESYSAGEPVRLVLYSADGAQHSGKYFYASETGVWNEVGRPTLEVSFGDP